jgi:hypothetical protein
LRDQTSWAFPSASHDARTLDANIAQLEAGRQISG